MLLGVTQTQTRNNLKVCIESLTSTRSVCPLPSAVFKSRVKVVGRYAFLLSTMGAKRKELKIKLKQIL